MENSNTSKNNENASDYSVMQISSVIMQRNLNTYIELVKHKTGGDISEEKKK